MNLTYLTNWHISHLGMASEKISYLLVLWEQQQRKMTEFISAQDFADKRPLVPDTTHLED
ncbi:hypothetical protein [Furfurilactobacillus siliginis]|uniref:Uncharacterized protein n=1 Tax=Furfurilactobacillus siliginis TaxID=348151 RepID=A0A510VMI8_9LACO|nr:hypothetical protein [Furfurilactobacillus siliginis]GEK28153.1 hypothetical protein LSI01_04640 [Furfurilactobacillus siliginis]